MDTSNVRVIPYNLTAEQSVLGSVLFDAECMGNVAQIVKPADFYDPRNKEIFEAVLDLFNLSKPIDPITLSEQLKRRGTLDKIGGETYIIEIANAVPTASNARHYAKIVADYAVRRRIISISAEISELAYAGEETTEKIIDISEHKIFEIAQNQDFTDFTQLRDVISISHAAITERARQNSKLNGISTGYSQLDDKLGGLSKGNLIILAARPAMGKTSFALNIAHRIALKNNAKVAVFSLEMSKEEIANRIWFSEAMIENKKLRNGTMQKDDWARLVTAISMLAEAKIFIDDTPAVSAMEIRSKCRRLMLEHGLDLIIIDHIQLMESIRRTESRQQEISEISRSLKMIAKDLGVPIIALSQLSRANANRQSKKPVLTDLRESGAIEQDADIVLMMHREDYYDPTTEYPDEMELIIGKNRNGETGSVYFRFQKEFTKFSSIDKVRSENE